jgi:hypothetical protein
MLRVAATQQFDWIPKCCAIIHDARGSVGLSVRSNYRLELALRAVRGAAGWSASGKWAGKAMVTLVPRPGRLVTSKSAASP